MMYIFIISADSEPSYDYNDSHVIVAYNEEEVIALAKDVAADEGKSVWEKGEIEKIGQYTGSRKLPHIVLTSFNAG